MSSSNLRFYIGLLIAGALVFFGVQALAEGYYLLVAFYILQYIVLATAWNILGGYGGYVNFGSACFFAVGGYSTVFFYKLLGLQTLKSLDCGWFVITGPYLSYLIIPASVLVGAVISGLMGLGTGYLTLRLRGVFFAISTLALTVVVQTLVLARRTMVVVRRNLAWAALYNAVCIPLAVLGWMPAWLAGAGMALSSLAVVLHALQLAHDRALLTAD